MREVNPKNTTRAYAFDMWMKAPMPMVTFFKTFDVSRLMKVSKKKGMKFNMLMCWCIGKAASQVKEFFMLPIGDKLIEYDTIAVNTIVANSKGEVSSCDIPFSDDLSIFNADYIRLTRQVAKTCENHDLTDSMVIGTSALAQYDIDGAVGMYSGIFNNPFMIWGRYSKGGSKQPSRYHSNFTTLRWMAHMLPASLICSKKKSTSCRKIHRKKCTLYTIRQH